ncbi:hypothetical protein BH11MYX4_BH11MYX4_12330 [soil metagenome]
MNEDPDVAKWQEGLRAGRKAQRAKLMTRVIPAAVVVVLFGGCLGAVKWIEVSRRAEGARESERTARARSHLSTEERAAAEQILADARARATASDAAKWAALLPPLLLLAVPSTEACPVDGAALVPKDPGSDATTAAKRTYTSLREGLVSMADIVNPDGTRDGRSRTPLALEQALSPHLTAMAGDLAPSDTGAAFLGRLRDDVKKFDDGHDGLLVVKDRTEAVFEAPKSRFVDGRLRGRFYLVSRATQSIVCVADVDTVGPRGFTIAGDNAPDLAGNARAAVARLLTSDAIASGLTAMTRAKAAVATPTPAASPGTSASARSAPRRR